MDIVKTYTKTEKKKAVTDWTEFAMDLNISQEEKNKIELKMTKMNNFFF